MTLLRDDNEHPIPPELRHTFAQVADAFANGDFSLASRPIAHVDPIDGDTARHIRACVDAYGAQLVTLDDVTWARSCYRFYDGHWIALIDLSTSEEAVSDLTLHARIDSEPKLRIRIESVHVP